MSNYLDSIPQAVATIVSSCYGAVLSGTGKAPSYLDETEKRITAFADQLARTLAKALLDASAGKL
jgi:hypothetical protein